MKYHIKPDGNPDVCRAQTPDSCRYGGGSDHFDTKEEARAAYELKKQRTGTAMTSLKKKVAVKNRKNDSNDFRKLAQTLEDMSFEELDDYTNESLENFEKIDKVIDYRSDKALQYTNKLEAINPFENKNSKCDKATFKRLRAELSTFRDKTAEMVEAHTESSFIEHRYEDISDAKSIGKAVVTTSFDPDTEEWMLARFNTVGGSDVGALAVMDFKDKDDLRYWDRQGLERVEEEKVNGITKAGLAEKKFNSFDSKEGNLYRGTVWEDRIRDKFAEQNPDIKVYNTKAQYKHPERDWQQLNFDGVISDRKDGKPNGILEIKTGNNADKWKDGIPLNYRAQVLYYLNATGLPKAKVVACIADAEYKTFDLHRDDPVAPGKYDKNMESYIKERVEPWFEGLRSKRGN